METNEGLTLLLSLLEGIHPLSIALVLYLGLVVGSFLNVVIYRLPLQRSIVMPGSACGSCGVPLRWYHNLPVISYLLQGGTCAHCGAPFSSRYMWIELLLGLSAVGLLYHDGGLGIAWAYHFALFAVATAVFFTDIDHWIIPDEVNLFGVIFGTALSVYMPDRGDMYTLEDISGWNLHSNLYSSLLGILVGWGFFKFIQFLGMLVARQEAMGEGDVKYAAVIGAFLGWQMALGAFFLSFLLGALYALPLLLTRNGKGKDPVPFGTFMSLAAVLVALWGGVIYQYFTFEMM